MGKNKGAIFGSILTITCCVAAGTLMFTYLNGMLSCETSKPGGNLPPVDDIPSEKDDFSTVIQTVGEYSKYDYETLNIRSNIDCVTPNKTKDKPAKILVVPVEFRDYKPFSNEEISYIEHAFNGEGENHETKAWESCKSFYYKSSNGHLNFDFQITDTFIPTISAQTFINNIDNYGTESSMILSEINSRGLKDNGINIDLNSSEYDINNDYYIDGIWMIYNNRNINDVYSKQYFWAYTTDYYYETETVPGPNNRLIGKYANCSILLLDDRGDISDLTNPDAHTIIHETGHMLGFDDYYDYNNSNQNSFTGQIDMMDLNIGDHNAFSKYAAGWTKSLVIEESQTLTLKPFATSFDSIILPSASYNGSAFSEYIIIEYYTPEGLFKYDSTHKFGGPSSGYPYTFTSSGLRMYHVDARLTMRTITNKGVTFGEYLGKDENIPLGKYEGNMLQQKLTYATVAHTNSLNDTFRNKDQKPLIELISSTGQKLFGVRGAVNKDLFKENTYNKTTFSPQTHQSYFKNSKFNDGSPMNYSIAIDEIKEDGITLTINVGK